MSNLTNPRSRTGSSSQTNPREAGGPKTFQKGEKKTLWKQRETPVKSGHVASEHIEPKFTPWFHDYRFWGPKK